MKKIFQISFFIVLTLVLVLAVFTATGTICPNVGWNSRAVSCSLTVSPLQGFQVLSFKLPGEILPNVGWHT
jgi:hypothetical protein